MNTYRTDDWYIHAWDGAEKLSEMAETGQDLMSELCTLSGAGMWEVSDDGQRLFHSLVGNDEHTRQIETGKRPIETYTIGDSLMPTRVAQYFGLGERVVCSNAGYFLQGDEIVDRPVFRIRHQESGETVIEKTTLKEILQEDGDEDVWWKPVEWRHIQVVVDETGGQSERFKLVSAILKRLADAEMAADTFIPYGDQFADSDFIDSI